MSTTVTARKKINQVDALKQSRAAKGVKPGVYVSDEEVMADYEAEAEEADRFLGKTAKCSLGEIAEIRPGRPAANAGARMDLVMTSVKLPSFIVAQLKAKAAETGKSYGQVVRELLGGALGILKGKTPP